MKISKKRWLAQIHPGSFWKIEVLELKVGVTVRDRRMIRPVASHFASVFICFALLLVMMSGCSVTVGPLVSLKMSPQFLKLSFYR